MNKFILDKNVQLFIDLNLNTDLNTLRLGKSPFSNISASELAEQIESKRHSRIKLPTWYASDAVYYPPKVSIEQSSSEETAKFKASLINGNHLIDLTGGFGVDSFFFSKKFTHVSHCEINKELSDIAAHNSEMLGAKNITYSCTDGSARLLPRDLQPDYVYIDPSRRRENRKVYMLEDCEPNILEILPLLKKSTHVMIKTSPMLDISAGFKAIGQVSSLYVVSLRNDCKELLWLINQTSDENKECPIICAMLRHGNPPLTYSFLLSEEKSYVISAYSNPMKYLYEPDAALMKAGCFKLISRDFEVGKVSANTHLYTSIDEKANFPGRTFIIHNSWNYKEFSKAKNITAANITCRNFSLNPEALRKKHKIQDGGDIYLFFCKNQDNRPIVVECAKV